MTRRLVDTNILVRYLVDDHPTYAAAAKALLLAAERGTIILVVVPAVVAECVYVLESFYKLTRSTLASQLDRLLDCSGLEIRDEKHIRRALQLYRDTSLGFIDCLLAAIASNEQLPLATFDRTIARKTGVVVSVDVPV